MRWSNRGPAVVLYVLLAATLLNGREQSMLSDVTADVDKLFTHQIQQPDSKDLYSSVVESGTDSLPTWLSYNPKTGTLEGVPADADKGTYVLSADGDLFALTVRNSVQEEVARPYHDISKPLVCKPQDSITRVTVVLNTNLNSLGPLQKVKLIKDLSAHLSLSSSHVSLRAEKKEDTADVSSTLVSGVGDQKKKSSQLGALLYWIVGCGAVKSHQVDILEHLESSAKNGTLSKSIGNGVSSWQVTIHKPRGATGKRRLKRQVLPTATVSPSPATEELATTRSSPKVTPTADVMLPKSTEESSAPVSQTTKPDLTTTVTTTTTAKPTSTEPSTTTTVTTTTTAPTTTTTTPTTTTTTPTTTTTTPTTTTPTTLTTTPTTTTTMPTTTTTTPTTTTPTAPTTTTAIPVPTTADSVITTEQTKVITKSTVLSPTAPSSTVTTASSLKNVTTTSDTHSPTMTVSRTSRSTISPTPMFPSPPTPPPPSPTIFTRPISSVPLTTISPTTIDTSTDLITKALQTPDPSTAAPSSIELPPPPSITPPPPNVNKAPVLNPKYETPISLEMTSGELFTWVIPDDLFTDPNNDRITYYVLDLMSERAVPWVRLDSVNNMIIALPLTQDKDINKFVLRAEDTKKLHKDVHLTVNVLPQTMDGITQVYKMVLAPPYSGTREQLVELIYTFNAKKMILGRILKVQSVNANKRLIEFGITNNHGDDSCPDEANVNDLVNLREWNTVELLMHKDYSSVEIVDVRSEPLPPCTNRPPTLTQNKKLRKSFETNLVATKGLLFNVKVPDKLFTDAEDINLKYMQLNLDLLGVELTDTSWVYLDNVSNTLLGLPWDIETPGLFQYSLTATDSGNLNDDLPIEIRVIEDRAAGETTNLFTITLEENFSKFVNNRQEQIRVYSRLNKVFGSDNPSIVVKSISKGSVVISFNVLDTQGAIGDKTDCSNVEAYVDAVFEGDNGLKRNFAFALSPYALREASFIGEGKCDYLEPRTGIINISPTTAVIIPKASFNIIYIVIPVVVFIIVLIIIVTVLVLKRKKRAAQESSKSNGTFIETGVPVVFDEDIKTLGQDEPAVTDPLLEESTPKPPAYPQNGDVESIPLNSTASEDAQQRYPTPPGSEPDDTNR